MRSRCYEKELEPKIVDAVARRWASDLETVSARLGIPGLGAALDGPLRKMAKSLTCPDCLHAHCGPAQRTCHCGCETVSGEGYKSKGATP